MVLRAVSWELDQDRAMAYRVQIHTHLLFITCLQMTGVLTGVPETDKQHKHKDFLTLATDETVFN